MLARPSTPTRGLEAVTYAHNQIVSKNSEKNNTAVKNLESTLNVSSSDTLETLSVDHLGESKEKKV